MKPHGNICLPNVVNWSSAAGIQIEIGSQHFNIVVGVVRGIVVQAILGLDFLNTYQCQITIATQTFSSALGKFCVALCSSKEQQHPIYAILNDTITILALSEMEVLASLNQVCSGHYEYLVENHLQGDVVVA